MPLTFIISVRKCQPLYPWFSFRSHNPDSVQVATAIKIIMTAGAPKMIAFAVESTAEGPLFHVPKCFGSGTGCTSKGWKFSVVTLSLICRWLAWIMLLMISSDCIMVRISPPSLTLTIFSGRCQSILHQIHNSVNFWVLQMLKNSSLRCRPGCCLTVHPMEQAMQSWSEPRD